MEQYQNLNLEKNNEAEVVEALTPGIISEYFDFANPILEIDWGEDGVPDEYKPEFIASHPDHTKVFIVKDESGEIVAGAKIKILDQETADRLGLSRGSLVGLMGVLLEYTAIRESDRNKGILGNLTSKRLEWAKERGADYACTELEIINPVSIWTKIRDGFTLVDIREPGAGIPHPYFVAVKVLTEKSDQKVFGDIVTPQWKEVEVGTNSYKELKSLFADGWVGVDIKGSDEQGFENLNIPWTLILEKTE